MDVRVVPSLAQPVSEIWRGLQESCTRNGEFYVAAPLSSTPLPIYRYLVDHAEHFPRWARVRFVLMDEQLDGDAPPFK
ncbi:MAG: hypothetical protein ACRDQZ_11475, partial [Mycobacteriales bacterium]